MLKINRNKNCFNKSSELEIFLSTGMEVFNNQNIKKQIKEEDKKNGNTDKKIDELIESYEKLKINRKNEKNEKEDIKPYLEFVEIRKTIEKKPETIEIDEEERIIENKDTNNIEDKTKELTFNIKEDESNLKELTFNVSNTDDNIKTENTENIKLNKKRFLLFKSKKNKEKNEFEKTIKKTKKQKNKKKFFSKNKENIIEKNKNKKIKHINKNQTKDNGKVIKKENIFLDEDIKKVLLITDNLLEKLPEDVINEFIKSADFELYERVINRIK
jgi:hypothetical protein